MRERAAILWHLMKKDWRYVRGWAALCGAVTVTAWLWILAHGALQFWPSCTTVSRSSCRPWL